MKLCCQLYWIPVFCVFVSDKIFEHCVPNCIFFRKACVLLCDFYSVVIFLRMQISLYSKTHYLLAQICVDLFISSFCSASGLQNLVAQRPPNE